MSQLVGKMPIDFREGISWNIILQITPTAQPRRKVLFELGYPPGGPLLTVQLDSSDRLSAVLVSSEGMRFDTSPVPPERFTMRPVWLQVELRPVIGGLNMGLSLDGTMLSRTVCTGNFDNSGEASQSIGASLEGNDPATFSVAEIVMAKPLAPGDQEQLRRYFSNKHGLKVA